MKQIKVKFKYVFQTHDIHVQKLQIDERTNFTQFLLSNHEIESL
jgi:hypothetical protein